MKEETKKFPEDEEPFPSVVRTPEMKLCRYELNDKAVYTDGLKVYISSVDKFTEQMRDASCVRQIDKDEYLYLRWLMYASLRSLSPNTHQEFFRNYDERCRSAQRILNALKSTEGVFPTHFDDEYLEVKIDPKNPEKILKELALRIFDEGINLSESIYRNNRKMSEKRFIEFLLASENRVESEHMYRV